jgi:hypothetical protein
MLSWSDGIVTVNDRHAILSVKTMGYKKSGQQRDKWVRRGFPELPFMGVKAAQPGWWAQIQAEMHGSGLKRGLVVVVAKDIIKAMENDPYMGPEGNGSLTFYTEMIEYDRVFCEQELVPYWGLTWDVVQVGEVPPALYFSGKSGSFEGLVPFNTKANKEITGSWSPCDFCDMVVACKAVYEQEDMREACEASLT